MKRHRCRLRTSSRFHPPREPLCSSASLGRTPHEAMLSGAVCVLAVAMIALAPFYISWSLAASRKTTATGIGFLWALCLAYSMTSALGFAAQNREGVAVARQVTQDAYEDIRRELLDLEARRKNAKAKEHARLDARVDDARRRLAAARNDRPAPVDAQSAFLSSLSFGALEAQNVRLALFALMVEACATFGLFAALSHAHRPPPASEQRWTPSLR